MTSLGGHISHLYEDWDLRFSDIKRIIRNLGEAKIDVYEKLDGQNLFISWDFDKDQLKVARNKQNIKDGGLDRYGLSLKFGDRPNIEKLFTEAYDELNKSFSALDYNLRVQIFGSLGSVYYPIEIVNPDLKNTIHYDGKYIVFHEYYPTLFGFDGMPISKALPRNMRMLKKSIKQLNDNSLWIIKKPSEFEYKAVNNQIIEKHIKEIEKIYKGKKNITESYTIRGYLLERLRADMTRFPLISEPIRRSLSKAICKWTGASHVGEIIKELDPQLHSYANNMVEEEKRQLINQLSPLERVINSFGSILLGQVKSDFIEYVEEESKRIKEEYNKACDFIRNNGNEKQKQIYEDLHNKIGKGKITMEGIVFLYNDKLYKLTGSFAPMNRIIATVKYSNQERVSNKTNKPIGLFAISG